MAFDYLDAGADDEITLRRNKDAYSELEMHFKILAGLEPPIDMRTTIFGEDVKLPFFGCPTAGNKMFHHEGEAAAAKAAEHHGSLYGLSSLATTGITEIGNLHKGPKVFQLYVWNLKYSANQIIEALKKPAWTYDFLSHDPYSYACINAEVPADSMASFVSEQISPAFNWKDAEWLLGEWNGPAATKGVCRPEDAVRSVETGFSTVWVSNHGARQLETSPATINILPSIREAVGPDVEIIMDGGVQRGTDIAKALALGADSVGVGKPYLYGLAAGGSEGVIKALEILRVELDRAMGLLGCGSVEQLKKEGPSLIKKRGASARDYPDRYAYERGFGGGVI